MGPRDLGSLTGRTYDVLVVGGGVYGLALACETASRGLTTALVEAADFGSGASFNLQKTAHGGLRSLQTGRVDRALESIAERRALARMAPWLLRPLPFLVGTYRSVSRGRLALRAAFVLDGWLGRHRNAGVEPELHLPRPRLLSKAATTRLFPGIRQERLTGGAQWYDYQIVETDRLTIALAEAAARSGAALVNYADAVSALRDGPRVVGMEVRDQLTGRSVAVAARAVVNAAGWRGGALLGLFGVRHPAPVLLAMNLVTSRPASDIALAAPTRSGRMLTLVPWRGRALIGTSQSAGTSRAAMPVVTEADVQAFVAEANEAFPALALDRRDVTLVHRGLVPAARVRDGEATLRAAPYVADHAADGAPGAFSMLGVKYTTARGVAERVAGLVARSLGRSLPRSRTATTTLPGAGIADHEALAIERSRAHGIELPATTLRHLVGRYAERAAAMVDIVQERPALGDRLAADVPTIGAEVVAAVRDEMAVRLTDIVIRRTGLGDAGRPGPEALAAAAALAATELGWDAERSRTEVAAVEAFYAIDGKDLGTD